MFGIVAMLSCFVIFTEAVIRQILHSNRRPNTKQKHYDPAMNSASIISPQKSARLPCWCCCQEVKNYQTLSLVHKFTQNIIKMDKLVSII